MPSKESLLEEFLKYKDEEYLKLFALQRTSYTRLLDGKKDIHNPVLYNQCEQEIEKMAKLIGRKNKKKLLAEGLEPKRKEIIN